MTKRMLRGKFRALTANVKKIKSEINNLRSYFKSLERKQYRMGANKNTKYITEKIINETKLFV